MNDPMLTAKKFYDLAILAKDATTPFENAAIFAAAQALAAQFNEEEERFDSYALEQVEKARWSICAAVGYDITNGHDKSQHVAFALGAASVLQDVLSRQL